VLQYAPIAFELLPCSCIAESNTRMIGVDRKRAGAARYSGNHKISRVFDSAMHEKGGQLEAIGAYC